MHRYSISLPPINARYKKRPRITLKSIGKQKLLPASWCNSILNWETILSQQDEISRMMDKIEYQVAIKHKKKVGVRHSALLTP